ncbi:MAG: hypothetical protein ACOYNN_04235 [Terrimicrobiaceae bacterium]
MKTQPPAWTITREGPHSYTLRFKIRSRTERPRILLQTDEHFDNAHTDLAKLRADHKEAVALGCPILKFGDVFCAMQGKWDKRADENQLRPEHRGGSYLDKLVNTAASFYSPFAKNIALISGGNHESSILLRHQTDLTERLAERMRMADSPLVVGEYWGFVRIVVEYSKTNRYSTVLHYHHGYGGGGEVTRGMIDNNRTRGQYHADIYVSGHIHRRNCDENIITALGQDHKIQRRTQLFLRSGTYKNEIDGWHAMQGRAARPVGGWWLDLKACDTGSMQPNAFRT